LLALSYILRLTLRYDRANAELTVLNEVGASLAATLDFGALFPAIYRGTGKLMDVNAFYIALLDEARREVQFAYLVESGIELAPRAVPLGNGLVTRVLQSGEPLAIDQLDLEEITTGAHFGSTQPVQSTLIAPLRAGERLLGAVSAQSYSTHAYTSRQLELLIAIARMAAIAIRNAQLFEREKTLLREREEFVSLVAHELKNPLAAISGYHQILTRRLRSDDDGLRRPLEVISEQTERLNRLVEDLLDLSRADAGRLALSLRPTNIRSLLKDVIEQLYAQGVTHRLNLELADDMPLVTVDTMRIAQVVQNLIGNAIKYSPSGGAIDVRAQVWPGDDPRWSERLQHVAGQHKRWIVVEIQDHGLGIAPKEVDKVFDRFFRASNTYEIQGVGLGLSICAELVRAHDGLIWVTSAIGEGSTFGFSLPVG
jgi:signal transduction histidine kinase